MACLSSKDEDSHQIPFVAAAGKEGLTLLIWDGVKLERSKQKVCKAAVDPLLKMV